MLQVSEKNPTSRRHMADLRTDLRSDRRRPSTSSKQLKLEGFSLATEKRVKVCSDSEEVRGGEEVKTERRGGERLHKARRSLPWKPSDVKQDERSEETL